MCDGNCDGCSEGKGCDKLYALTMWQLDLFSKYNALVPKGKPIPLVVQNPSNSATLDHLLQNFFANKSALIPEGANAYAASDFIGDTQHFRKDENDNEKQFSVYAIQFYHLGGGL